VKAKDKTTNKEQSIRIEASSGLSKEEIEKMQKDAEANAADDLKKKELVDAKNTAEQLIYTAEKALKDAPTVPEDIKAGVNMKIDTLKKESGSGVLENIRTATEGLSTELQKIGEYLSKNQTGTETPKEGEVKDAEVKEEPKA
jgi:molecular chaperone DnaK